MNAIIGLVAYPLGLIMWFLYSFLSNYGLVIFAFTLITKVLLLPMSIHQHKSVISQTRLRPKMAEIKNKYGKNPQKYNEEIMALYQKEGVNPASGCGSSLVQFPIIFGMIGVVYAPLKYILRLSDDVIAKASQITNQLLGNTLVQSNMRGEQYTIIKTLRRNPQAFQELGKDVVDKILDLRFNFLGMDLSLTPSIPHRMSDLSWLMLIPVLSGLTSLLVSLQSMKNSSSTAIDDASKQAASSMKMMMFVMPLFSAWISFKFPAGIGLYWIFSNVFVILQNYILYKKYNPVEIVAKAKEELEKQKEKDRLERIEARKRLNNGEILDKEDVFKGLSQKEINKQKLANARKRDAEKYGDYND